MHGRSISMVLAVLVVALLAACIRFEAPTTQAVPVGANEVIHDVLVGDVTGDGRGDLLVGLGTSRYESLRSQVMVSCGTGCTTPGESIAGFRPTLIADFDSDGIDDVVISSALYQGAARLYFGGAATATRPAGLAQDDWIPLPNSWDYATGDLDGDGDLDLVQTTTFMTYYLERRRLLNDGTGSFTDAGRIGYSGPLNAGGGGMLLVNNGVRDVVYERTSGVWSPSLPPGTFGAVDIDGDAIDDLIATVDDQVTFFRGTGAGFTPLPAYQILEIPSITSWYVGDLDADGHTDLWINDAYARTTTLLGGSGDGGFPYEPAGSVPPGRLRFGDLDGDQLPEGIGIATDSRSLLIYPNTSFT
jgi:hypothetical protein